VKRAALLPALIVVLATTGPAVAGAKDAYQNFYRGKKQATTVGALENAERNLQSVRIGMAEIDFLVAMRMEVLANKGKPYDARLDGYLPVISKAINSTAAQERRYMVFGYVAAEQEVPVFTVALEDRRVAAIDRSDSAASAPAVAALTEPMGAAGPMPGSDPVATVEEPCEQTPRTHPCKDETMLVANGGSPEADADADAEISR
jgi:hypothetical protein